MGMMRVGPSGEIVEPLHELPPIQTQDVTAVHDFVSWAPQASAGGGHVALGQVVWGGAIRSIVMGFDVDGTPLGDVLFYGTDLAVASTDTRTWVLADYQGGALELTEVGCVLP